MTERVIDTNLKRILELEGKVSNLNIRLMGLEREFTQLQRRLELERDKTV